MPQPFDYHRHQLHCERIPLERLARKFATPLYVYSASEIKSRVALFEQAFADVPHTIGYAVKANSNLAVLKLLAKLGCGFDIVSGGELERVRVAAPTRLKEVVFSGVGKQVAEIDAALRLEILIFNVESPAELEVLSARAQSLRKKARVALRVNPDVNAETHPYISTGLREHKFGVDIKLAPELYARAAEAKWLEVAGVSCHIGSQITDVAPFGEALRRLRALIIALRAAGHSIRYVDAGGGLGISYRTQPGASRQDDFPVRVRQYAAQVKTALAGLGVHLLLEPGRAIIAHAGALVTRVVYTKTNGSKKFVITDAAMNDLIRPALYQAHHEIVAVKQAKVEMEVVDIVGPVCETGDFFAHDRRIPAVREGALLAILDAGAYGMSLASNYNTRLRAAEVLVDGKRVKLVRRRETMRDLLRPEMV
ncbi:MAG: diaminopimelate decarboxylase [Acidobacteriaceae bacterium]